MTKIGYARVSSASQSYDEQARLLTEAGCTIVRSEKQSGASLEGREELETLIQFLRPGDAIVVTKLDRLARSLKDLLVTVERIEKAGATLVMLNLSIDTSTAAGRMFLQMLGAVAEFERALIRDRQMAGIAAARAAGKSLGGRKPSIDRQSVLDLLIADVPKVEIARRLHIGEASVYKIIQELMKDGKISIEKKERVVVSKTYVAKPRHDLAEQVAKLGSDSLLPPDFK